MSRRTWLGSPDKFARLRRIEGLDPEKDYREITRLFYEDFQTIMLVQSVTGFLFTYASPRMSRILSATGHSEHQAGKRLVDTALLVRAVQEHGVGPGEGRDAARRVNAMHRRYDIHQDDFIAVGCDVPLMSIEIATRFGWRAVTDAERESLRLQSGEQARAFGSHRPLPDTLEGMRAVWEHYLDTHAVYEPQNEVLAKALMKYVPTMMPAPVRPLVGPVLLPQVDPRILRACGLRPPSNLARRLSTAALRGLGRRDPVPDGAPDGMLDLARTVYPNGWEISDLGTQP
jgi:hypothetical protein